jgi:hypothetical protein
MHDPTVDDLADHPPAHQAGEICLDHTPTKWRRQRRSVLDDCDCHDHPPQYEHAHACAAADCRMAIVPVRPFAFCLAADESCVPWVTFRPKATLLSS